MKGQIKCKYRKQSVLLSAHCPKSCRPISKDIRTEFLLAVPYTPPPPCLGTALCKNRLMVPRSNSRTTFLNHSIGFFVVLVDAGQLFRCAGQHFMCIAWFAGFGRSYLLLYHVFHSLLYTMDVPMYTAGESVFYPRSAGSLVPATVLGPGAQCRLSTNTMHPAALIANLSRPIPGILNSPDWDSAPSRSRPHPKGHGLRSDPLNDMHGILPPPPPPCATCPDTT